MNLSGFARSALTVPRGGRLQLLPPLLLVAACVGLPAPATGEGPPSASVALTASGAGGSASEALNPLMLPALSAAFDTSPQGLSASLAGVVGGQGGAPATAVNAGSSSAPRGAAGARASNAFAIVRVSVARGGQIVETVKVPGPGRLALKATTPRRVPVGARTSHRRTLVRALTIGGAQAAVAPGLHTVALRLRATAPRARLLVVTLTTTYTPSGGEPRTLKRSLTLHKSGKGRRR
jgi:hypothetical protein